MLRSNDFIVGPLLPEPDNTGVGKHLISFFRAQILYLYMVKEKPPLDPV